eukprot:TRINITY_DN3218_c0_g1_i2.p1 TRINITY_DN3218_c0_g1~~TRINITY_DN3218_c0_g1_i2.p1  ORF type:complete len:248 (-),score=45.93 TRINITY_DN3218_c0_g1_i2:468-1211(-)
MDNQQKGKIQTVTGLVEPQHLGKVMMHEHVVVDYSKNFGRPQQGTTRSQIGGLSDEELDELWDAPLCCENVGHCRNYFSQNKDNMILSDVKLISQELSFYKKHGGHSIVECSIPGIGRNPKSLFEASKLSGVNIVMGTGYYLSRAHPKDMDQKTVEQIAETFVHEIQVGADDTEIKAGIIGELGCTTEITSNELKVLKAAVLAQKKTGASISIHPGYKKESPIEIINILKKEGANISRVIMGHVDRF